MLNKAVIQGRLTTDPELRNTQGGTAVTSFCIASERSYIPKGGEKQTDFIDVVAWQHLAETICRHWKKGQPIIVEGQIQTRSYTDRNGNKRKAVEIIASAAHFVESKKAADEFDQRPAENDDFSQLAEWDDGDLPF